jgi:hypothetical protein
LLSEIKTFWKARGDEKAELEDEEWLFDLIFQGDFIVKIRYMNFELQGKNKCITEKMSTDSSYKSKFELIMTDPTNNTFNHFLNMEDHLEKYHGFVFQTKKRVTEICCYPRFGKQIL